MPQSRIAQIDGYQLWSDGVFFNEFAVKCPLPVAELNDRLLDAGMIGGYDLGQDYPGMEDTMLIAVTEMNQKEDIDFLVEVLEEVANG